MTESRSITDPELMSEIFEDDEDGRRIMAIAFDLQKALTEHQPANSEALMDIHAALSLLMALYHCAHCPEVEDNAIIQYYDHMIQNVRRDIRFEWDQSEAGSVGINDVDDIDASDDPGATRH